MKLQFGKKDLEIVPETEMERGWLEEVLGADIDNFQTIIERRNVLGTSALAYLVVRKGDEP